MNFDSDRLWIAVEAEDPRFDGWVFCGVKTTGIYCRPSCPARTPKRENVRFFATAAAAQAAGFRACKRCRPDATPGSPEWDLHADLVGRAMRMIADGVVDRDGVGGLAGRLGYTERHVHRQLVATVGAGPLALARAQRAQTARILLETTVVPITGVAFAAGFQSVRQFNATVREVFALTPRELRARARRGERAEEGDALSLRLPYRAPLDGDGLIAFLGLRAVPGIEEVHDGAYRRSLRLPHGSGVVELRPADGYVHARYWLQDLRDLAAAMQRSRALLDLDSDPLSVAETLGEDRLLGALVRQAPGRRVPGHVDGGELAIRAVLGQQVSLKGAATLAGRLVAQYGEPLERPLGTVTHTFPSMHVLGEIDPEQLAMPRARGRALLGLARALASGELTLDAGSDRVEARGRLLELPGIGVWTADYIAMRALGDPDAFLPSDLGVRHALERLGQDGRPAAAQRIAERWRPYRAYALQHLWASLSPPVEASDLTPSSTTTSPGDAERLAA
jgi:AraC family transcriptional regulator of adaptative response / DNA-3-methyladenine glycosylase II